MRPGWSLVTALLLLPLSGCFGPAEPARPVEPAKVGYDPTTVHVLSVAVQNVTVSGSDGTALAVRAYVPTLSPDVGAGLVVFLHGWGNDKESYESGQSYPLATPVGAQVPTGTNRLRAFAEAGLVAVAYDARGFGQSGGLATVAGPAELADLHAVIQWAQAAYHTNGRVGVIGASYGGGQAYQAWATDPLVTTAVPMYGWVDLYQALIPGNVPKLEWAQFLYLYGQGGTGRYDPMVHQWYTNLYTRLDLGTVHRQMDERSTLPRNLASGKPLLICQGMEESLFPQVDQAWKAAGAAGAFVRVDVFRGGHGADNDGCWDRALDWVRFFLQGYDTGVDRWPALETVDAVVAGTALPGATVPSLAPTRYDAFPDPAATELHLRSGALYQGPASDMAFTVQQSPVANPLEEPAALWDQSGMPTSDLPDQARTDPTAVVFTTDPLHAGVLVGAPLLHLALHGTTATPYQVAGTLLVLHKDGTSQIISRGAAAALGNDDVADGTLTLRFHWTHATLVPNDKIVLELANNDPAWWMPLATQAASPTFDGRSTLELPIAS